jgi:hypothetical protein
MNLILINGYPYPYPADAPDDDSLMQPNGPVIRGVKHFEWLHTVTVEFEDLQSFTNAKAATGWKDWGTKGLVLEATTSAADGYGHPAIVVNDVAYCGFILEG